MVSKNQNSMFWKQQHLIVVIGMLKAKRLAVKGIGVSA